MNNRESIDFIGIGAPRSGTTWLSDCLLQHPDIRFPNSGDGSSGLDFYSLVGKKELDFFTTGTDGLGRSNLHNGLDWYFSQFPDARTGIRRGEFSPSYLSDPGSARRIRDAFPEVKLLAILRNPVDMIYSWYWYLKVSVVREPARTFEEAIERGLIVRLGLYYQDLKRYFDLFPNDRIRVILFDDIKSDPAEVIRETYRFLGVRDDFVPSSLRKKVNATPRTKYGLIKKWAAGAVRFLRKVGLGPVIDHPKISGTLFHLYCRVNLGSDAYPPMSPKTRERLTEYYREDITKLEALIGRDLSAWR